MTKITITVEEYDPETQVYCKKESIVDEQIFQIPYSIKILIDTLKKSVKRDFRIRQAAQKKKIRSESEYLSSIWPQTAV